MGNSYGNITVKGPTHEQLVEFFTEAGRAAYVSPPVGDVTVVFDESDMRPEPALLARFTLKFRCPALYVAVYDDDVMLYWLCGAGRSLDEYVSRPEAVPKRPERSQGGDASKLITAFDARTDAAVVGAVLRKRTKIDEQGQGCYRMESERHRDLARVLNLPEFAAGTGFTYIQQGELPKALAQVKLSYTSGSGGHPTH